LPESAKSSTQTDDSLWTVVLAGGIGSRFWPVSTRERPKQLLPLASERPLIVDTLERAQALVPEQRLRILAGSHLARPFRAQLQGFSDEVYWIEPQARGTCPVLAWAAWEIHRTDPDAVMVSLHADHRIHPISSFQRTIQTAVQIARRDDLLVCIGVVPDRVETGFGHVERGEGLETSDDIAAHRVHAFHEKPDAETAERYVRDGYLWNTGLFVWKVSTFLSEVAEHAPEVYECMTVLDGGGESAVESFFAAVPACSVDTAVMERSRRVGTVTALFSWDDVGSWEALSRTRPADADGNVLIGDAVSVDGSGNIAFVDQGEVVLFGVDDLVVVRTGETTLVMPRGRVPDIKALLAELAGDDV
jgi:mannose-1-phosphate guanylyltransferase